jgi:hypothetical protein
MSLRRLGLLVVAVASGLVASAADEPVVLKYKLAKGDKLLLRNEQEMKQLQTVMGIKIDTTMNQESITSQVVGAIDEKGNAALKTKFERRKMKMDGQQGKYEFDSRSTERDSTSAIGGQMTPLLERLTGSEYEVKVSPRGEIVEVKGFAELIADLLKDNPFGQFAGAAADNASAKLNEQENYVILSDKAVKPGDTWEVPIEMELTKAGKFKGKNTYTYEADDKVGDRKTIRIGMTTEMSIDLNVESDQAKVKGTISTVNSSGTAQFDPAAGRLLSVKRAISMGGQLTVEAGGVLLTVDMTQDQTSTSTLLDKLPE